MYSLNEYGQAETFQEIQPWGSSSYTIIPGTHISFQTVKQYVDIFTNPFYERMLFLDGVLQSTSSDEHIYHEALVSFGFPTECSTPSTFLVAGGSEGACIREILASACPVKEIVMVDWDKELVEHMRTESFHQGGLMSPLVRYVFQDFTKFMSADTGIYDSIILDLLDPESPGDVQCLLELVTLALPRLAPGASIVMNAGGCHKTLTSIQSKLYEMNRGITVTSRPVYVPSFQEMWYILCVRPGSKCVV